MTPKTQTLHPVLHHELVYQEQTNVSEGQIFLQKCRYSEHIMYYVLRHVFHYESKTPPLIGEVNLRCLSIHFESNGDRINSWSITQSLEIKVDE